MLEINSKAPDFSLPDENGTIHKLSDYLGKKVVLYFYMIYDCPCMRLGYYLMALPMPKISTASQFQQNKGRMHTSLAASHSQLIELSTSSL